MMTQEEMIHKATEFLALAKELNYDAAALYAKEPMMMQILGGTAVGSVILLMILKGMMSKSGANKALKYLDHENNEFYDIIAYYNKITKRLPGANADYIEALKAKNGTTYLMMIRLLEDTTMEQKIQRYTEMSKVFTELGEATRDEELREYFLELAQSEKLKNEISSYMSRFTFNDESLEALISIVDYASTLEEPQDILSIITKKLDTINFGESLELYNFVQTLEEDRLGEIYTYCATKLETLFSDASSIVAGEILENLLENNEQSKVLSYIQTLNIATYLQELNYKYFNQRDDLEFDLAFIANSTPINENYASYLETLFTNNWRDDEFLEMLVNRQNIINVIGHDRARNVIERVDALRKEYDEKTILDEALKTAQEAKELAQEAKDLAQIQTEA